jgi:hypothetical protein
MLSVPTSILPAKSRAVPAGVCLLVVPVSVFQASGPTGLGHSLSGLAPHLSRCLADFPCSLQPLSARFNHCSSGITSRRASPVCVVVPTRVGKDHRSKQENEKQYFHEVVYGRSS